MNIDLYQYIGMHVVVDWDSNYRKPARIFGFLSAVTDWGIFIDVGGEMPDFIGWHAIARIQATRDNLKNEADTFQANAMVTLELAKVVKDSPESFGNGLAVILQPASPNPNPGIVRILFPPFANLPATVWALSLQALTAAAQSAARSLSNAEELRASKEKPSVIGTFLAEETSIDM